MNQPELYVHVIGRSLERVSKLGGPGTETYPWIGTNQWAIRAHDKSLVMRLALPLGTEANAAVFEKAIHLIRAGIWLADDAWESWFGSICAAVHESVPSSAQSKWLWNLEGSTLSVCAYDAGYDFDLYPTSEHPNGDATVKWILRTIQPSIEKEQA